MSRTPVRRSSRRLSRPSPLRVRAVVTAAVLVLTVPSCARQVPPSQAPSSPTDAQHDPVIAAAGDISCASDVATSAQCQQKATSDLLVKAAPLSAVLALGDLQYDAGRLDNFLRFYEPTWGRVKNITRPVPGDHDYSGFDAAGYFQYFGAQAGPADKGYYSFDLGSWHLVALNGQCEQVGGCDDGSAQERWLAADLAAHPSKCLLAYWDTPRFSTGEGRNDDDFDAFWRDLVAAGAEVVLNADEHHYERFAPQDPDGRANPDGIREFIVGTGGKSHQPFAASPEDNSEVRNANTFGVLMMTLHKNSYEWEFTPIAGQTFTDRGRENCH